MCSDMTAFMTDHDEEEQGGEEQGRKMNHSLLRKRTARLAAVQCAYARMIIPNARKEMLIEWQYTQTDETASLPAKPQQTLLRAVFVGTEDMREAIDQRAEEILTERWMSGRMPKVMRALLRCERWVLALAMR